MRTCVVGGGLAGTLLAWRLALAAPRDVIDLVLGARCRADATTASGGAVRAYEPDPEQRRLATASLVELLASPTLRRWARYQRVPSVYLPSGGPVATADLAQIDRSVPGSVQELSATGLARLGWADVHPGAVAVAEHRAGYLVPSRLRDAVLADAAVRRRVRPVPAALAALTIRDDDTLECMVGADRRRYDVVVIAAGAWTPGLLARAGLPAGEYRTKSIQYTVHRTEGWRPPQFVDEVIGLYGRPAPDGGLLLGLPTDQWGVDPDRPPVTPALHDQAARLARTRFPKLRIGPAARTVGGADCYGAHPTLSLRPVVDTGHRLFTFTGGAGGSVKTALAASQEAATTLAEDQDGPALTPLAPRKGMP